MSLFGAGTKVNQKIEQPFRLVELHPRKPRRFFALKRCNMKRVCNTCHNVKYTNEFNGESYRCNDCQSKIIPKSIRVKEYIKKRREDDPLFRLRTSIVSKTGQAIKAKKWQSGGYNERLFGCDRDTLIKHIERKFKQGMNWSNRPLWHIDHIVPLSSAKNEEQMYSLARYTNLSPEWKNENLRKSASIPFQVFREGGENDHAEKIFQWYYFKTDCTRNIAVDCAIYAIDLLLINSLAHISYWERVKEVLKSYKI